jgi:hypothetical protein
VSDGRHLDAGNPAQRLHVGRSDETDTADSDLHLVHDSLLQRVYLQILRKLYPGVKNEEISALFRGLHTPRRLRRCSSSRDWAVVTLCPGRGSRRSCTRSC